MPGATLAMALAEAGAGRPHEGRRMGGILRRASLLSDGGEASIAIDGDHPPLTVSARFGSVECAVRRKFIRAAHFAAFRNLTRPVAVLGDHSGNRASSFSIEDMANRSASTGSRFMRAANARASSRRGQLATRRSACVRSKTSQGPPLRRETANRASDGVSLVIARSQLAGRRSS
jgi:hypothetical protein